MKTETLPSSKTGLEGRIDYGKLTLLQLSERIVDNDDRRALEQLHDRRLKVHKQQKKATCLVDRIAGFMKSPIAEFWCGGDRQILEDAYNMTLDKFFNIPTRQVNGQQQGSDCRYYFKAFIKYAIDKLKAEPPTNAIEAEIASAKILLKLVRWHFFLSCLEAKRQARKLRRRYMWTVNAKTLYLWLPLELIGHRCRQWLEDNVPDVDPYRPGEQDRVQAIIDRLLTKRRIFYLSQLDMMGERLPSYPCSKPSTVQAQISSIGMAEAVATEKAENIMLQRPAIRALGKDKLRQLIRTIFTKIANSDYAENEIAKSFGLSVSTMSRFAGAYWKRYCDDVIISAPPDLWKNTAGVLSSCPDFVIACRSAGVWKRICGVLDTEKTREDSR